MSAHHSSLVAYACDDWAGSGVTLTISPETRTYEYSATNTRTRETGDLVIEGAVSAGRTADGSRCNQRIKLARRDAGGLPSGRRARSSSAARQLQPILIAHP